MGRAYLPGTLRSPLFRAGALLCVCASLATFSRLTAQSTLPRDFERVHFARAEAWLDRLFSKAGIGVRVESMRKIRHALEMRGWADSLASTRAQRLAAACAVTAGFKADDEAFLERFDWFLLALPEIVDREKLESDRVRLGEVMRAIYPLLRPVVVHDPQAPSKDRDRVHLTARTVFGLQKPPGLELRMQILQGEKLLLSQERGDSQDPKGWMLYDLELPFTIDRKIATGPLLARLQVGREGSWPRGDDPTSAVRFWNLPFWHRRCWALFDKSAKLLGQRRLLDLAAKDSDWARYALLQDEVLRPMLGRDYIHRSWPLQALTEAEKLIAWLARRQSQASKEPVPVGEGAISEDAGTEPLPDSGDRSFGIVAGEDELRRVLPLRVVWGPRHEKIAPTLLFVLPPGGHDENWVVDGLGYSLENVQHVPGAIIAFAHEPLEQGYLEGAQRLLAKRFGVKTRGTTLAGFLDGGTRARFAWPQFKGMLAELALVGQELPDLQTLRAERRVHRLRVISAYGYPSKLRAKKLMALPSFASQRARIAYDLSEAQPRSLREAFDLLVRRTFL